MKSTVRNSTLDSTIAGSLLFAVFLWGANNAGTKFLVHIWPPVFVGATRFFLAGLIFMALLHWTRLFGAPRPISATASRRLWLGSGLTLAIYIVVFNWALRLTSVSHVTLYLGASPVWALLWEGAPERSWKTAQRYGAAALALLGVVVLLWPTLHSGTTGPKELLGEALGIACSVLWTLYGRQCRAVGTELSGPEITAYSFWRAGLWLAPVALLEFLAQPTPVPWNAKAALVQSFCILGGGIVSFGLWSNALRHWSTSKVYLFNNLIPLSTMTWAHFCLGEPFTRTYWVAMVLVALGVVLGQLNWRKTAS